MSRLISLTRQASPLAARIEWQVVDDDHPLRRMEPGVLLDKLGAVASELVHGAVKGPGVAADVERLRVFAPLHAGDRLVVTAALEPVRHQRHAVSVVVRKKTSVVSAGVLTFVDASAPLRWASGASSNRLRSGARDGKAPVETTFHARTKGADWVLDGNPLEWVHASALLSAQGFVGGPAEFVGVQGLSRLGPVTAGEALVLQCSVVHSVNDVVSVLSHVRSAGTSRDVLWAVSSFRSLAGAAPVLLRDWPHWLGVAPLDAEPGALTGRP